MIDIEEALAHVRADLEMSGCPEFVIEKTLDALRHEHEARARLIKGIIGA